MKIVFQPPSKTAPGFLKRQKEAVEFGNALTSGSITPALLDDLVAWLAKYVTEPADKEEAIAALWDASEEQFIELVDSLKGTPAGETIDPPNAAP